VSQATITAPFAGIITQKFADAGAVVGPGTPIVTLQGSGEIELDVAVPEDSAAAVSPGARVQVRVDALDATTGGTVRAVAPAENASLRASSVRISVDPIRGLAPGMFARVRFNGAPHQGVGVPLAAIVTRGGQAGVFSIDGSTATFLPVQTAALSGALVEVRGVKAGTRIAASNLAQLTEGAAVSTSK
jgi:RND family efflux transporter MFP subunit